MANRTLAQSRQFKRGILKAINSLPSRVLRRRVMATPPTVAFGATNPLSAGKQWPFVIPINPVAANNPVGGTFASLFGAGKPMIKGITSPDYQYVIYQNVDQGGGVYGASLIGLAMQHYGSRIVLAVKGSSNQNMLAKVDGEYVSLTAQSTGSTNALQYWDLNFGTSALREIEFLLQGAVTPNAIWTAATDTLVPAPLRGPRILIQWDSYGDTGADAGSCSSAATLAMEALGWNNYVLAARGGRGFYAGTPTYEAGLANDGPAGGGNYDLIIAVGSINDGNYTVAQVGGAVSSWAAAVAALYPNALPIATSQCLVKGATFSGPLPFLKAAATKAAIESAGGLFMNLIERPMVPGVTPATNALAASAAQNATTLSLTSIPVFGATYAFADGTRVLIKAISGSGPYTATLDGGGLGAAQSAGATMTQVGDSPWTGSGNTSAPAGDGNCDVVVKSDNHPPQAGHDMIGGLIAARLIETLRSYAPA